MEEKWGKKIKTGSGSGKEQTGWNRRVGEKQKAVKLKRKRGTTKTEEKMSILRYGGNKKPSKFICLVLKMLQIQPEKEIVVEFIKNEEYRCVHSSFSFSLNLISGILRDLRGIFHSTRFIYLF